MTKYSHGEIPDSRGLNRNVIENIDIPEIEPDSESVDVDTCDDPRIAVTLERFPFLSYGRVGRDSFLGIIQNSDNQFVSMYILDLIPTEELRKVFLELGDRWWWESNRMIPINVFIKDQRFKWFRPSLRMFSGKDFELLSGHRVSLAETMNRRIRKRQITLVRKMD